MTSTNHLNSISAQIIKDHGAAELAICARKGSPFLIYPPQ